MHSSRGIVNEFRHKCQQNSYTRYWGNEHRGTKDVCRRSILGFVRYRAVTPAKIQQRTAIGDVHILDEAHKDRVVAAVVRERYPALESRQRIGENGHALEPLAMVHTIKLVSQGV